MNSCIYRGRVSHHRLAPVEHAFTYRLFMMYLDLEELETVFRQSLLWSMRWPSVAWFRRSEHLGDPLQPLGQSVRQFLHEQTGQIHDGPIRMLTHLRYFGFQMNPVSFYFCFDNDEKLLRIIAEVNNTPWGQQHCYVLGPEHFSPAADQQLVSKDFHVSPFLPMDMQYRWQVSQPGNELKIGIRNLQSQQPMLDVAMTMQQHPITAHSLRLILLRFPLMTGRVFAAIYWQAFRLWRKRVPFFSHPGKKPKRASKRKECSVANHSSSEAATRNV